MDDLEKVANLGYVESFTYLGEAYISGFLVRRDKDKALAYFCKAAEAGNPKGMYWLGRMYAYGYSVKANAQKAIDWWGKAADAGSSDAMIAIGDTYFLGTSEIDEATGKRMVSLGNANLQREEDIAQAEAWYIKAVEVGDDMTKRALEKLYELLSHKSKNTAAGEKLRLDDRKLADIDIAQTMERLAVFYLAQDDYFENDEHKAKRTYWLNQAAKHESKYAKQLLGSVVA
ncbi:MAG: sel1 repeat family protein [Pseudobutyrivibrio sp.]|nr:sel1 repeat family protein [Pseudobutyrivibrio sp.]